MSGTGKLVSAGFSSSSEIKEEIKEASNYIQANLTRISSSAKYKENDYYLKATDLNGIGKSKGISLAVFISLCSGILERPVQSQTVILGSFSIGGSVIATESLPDALQIASDAGAKKVLIPVVDMVHIGKVPPELLSKFQLLIYSDPIDAVFKVIGGWVNYPTAKDDWRGNIGFGLMVEKLIHMGITGMRKKTCLHMNFMI